MHDEHHEGNTPMPVPRTSVGAQPIGNTCDHWWQVAPTKWTERMLTASKTGDRGGVATTSVARRGRHSSVAAHGHWSANLTVDPTDWRAGCGRPACPVRREGEPA